MARLGFVGTGTMGTPMAARLLSAGHDLLVHDRLPTATEALVAGGARAVGSPAAAAEGVEAVLLSLPGPDEVVEAVTGPEGVLAADPPPSLIIDLSTNAPDVVADLARRSASVGVSFVDAPVSGGLAKARTGTLSVLVGASDEAWAAAEPYLAPIGDQRFLVGPVGAGTVAKLVNNQVFLAAGLVVQEAFVAATAAGLDPSALFAVLKASSAGPYLGLGPLLLGRSFDNVIFRLDIAAKDLQLAVRAAAGAGVEVPVTEAAARLYAEAAEAGLGDRVFHATLLELERRAEVEVPALRRPERAP
jgi:3-hydroxyisobutyrate dehydrogenase-like beta-hydroxyacid dehydrogenase